MRYLHSLLLFLFLIPGASLLHARHIYQIEEIELTAEGTYDHPLLDVAIRCRFVGGKGDTVLQEAFWDGGRTYRVRFSPPYGGTWHWESECSDEDDAGLHGQRGELTARALQSEGFFSSEGWPTVSPDRRYLTHESGKPFFWLACTAWEITWKSTRDQAEAYLDDRQSKNFTAIQIVVFSHQAIDEFGVTNRNGASSALDSGDYSRLNPEYFRYLDTIVSMVNERDMVAVLVPMWAGTSELYAPNSYPHHLDRIEALTVARYVGARYAADNVIWIMGGDNSYDTEERRALFSEFAWAREQAGSPDQLVTLHPSGWSASFDYFENDTPWLDFHMYQSSHLAYGDFTWQAAASGYRLDPPIPVLNGEAAYEGIYNNLWEPGDTLHPDRETWRIQPVHIRQASYESILSGALVGITYGANGVWQWHVPGIFVTHRPEHMVEEAWQMPGSLHMMTLREIMEDVDWYELVPNQELIASKETVDDEYVAIAESDRSIVAYLPAHTTSVTLSRRVIQDTFCYSFISPVTGEKGDCIPVTLTPDDTITLRIVPPDSNDWVLYVDKTYIPDLPPQPGDTLAVEVRPHPIAFSGELVVNAWPPVDVDLGIYSVRGELVRRVSAVDIEEFKVELNDLLPGSYFYRIELVREGGTPSVRHGGFVVLGEE